MNDLNQWSTVVIAVIAVLTFVGGSGWLKYFLEHRSQKRAEVKAILEGFLMPLEAILEQNRRVHDVLIHDGDLHNLECPPDYLQSYFASLPDTDSRKLVWRTLIEGILRDNQRAIELIQKNAGRLLHGDFREVCNDYIEHANRWDAVWRAAIGDQPVPESLRNSDALLAPVFPDKMNSLLIKEIEDRRRQAGLS